MGGKVVNGKGRGAWIEEQGIRAELEQMYTNSLLAQTVRVLLHPITKNQPISYHPGDSQTLPNPPVA